MKFPQFLSSFLTLAAIASAGDGPGGIGSTTDVNSPLRLWIKSESMQDGALPNLTGPSGTLTNSGASSAPNIHQDRGRRRDSQLYPFVFTYLGMEFDDLPGSTVAMDRFDSSRNGTYVSGTNGDPVPGGRFFGSTATSFRDGAHIALPSIPNLESLTTNFRISAWIKPDAVSGRQYFLRAGSGGWGLGLQDDHVVFTNFGIDDFIFDDLSITPGIWTHIQVQITDDSSNSEKDVELRVNGDFRNSNFASIPGSGFQIVEGSISASSATAPYTIGASSGGFDGSLSGLYVRQIDWDFTSQGMVDSSLRNEAEQADLIRTAREVPNNHHAWASLQADQANGLSTSSWNAGITSEITLFTAVRYQGDQLGTTGPGTTLLRSSNDNLVLQLPDASGRVSWHAGSALNPGSYETGSAPLRTPFNHSGEVGAREFRLWSFTQGFSGGQRILENGVLLAARSNQGQTFPISDLQFGNYSTSGTAGVSASHDLSEVIVFNRELNPVEKLIVDNYLGAKFGHPNVAGADWFLGDDADKGDFDSHLIGIAGIASWTHGSSAGGGLVLENVSFIDPNTSKRLLAAQKTGGLTCTALPSAIDMAWDRWWYMQHSGEGGDVRVQLDYAATDLVVPPATEHFLLYSASQDGPFSIVARATSTPMTVDFGNLEVGTALKTGYYAIGYNRGAMNVLPSNVFAINTTEAGADSAIATALTTINNQANDGSVYQLDLSSLVKGTAGPPNASNTFIVSRSATWPDIRRNVVITGPVLSTPGRFVLDGQDTVQPLAIHDGQVEIYHIAIKNGLAGGASSNRAGLGGGLSIFRGDVLLEDCVILNCEARGSDGFIFDAGQTETLAPSMAGWNGAFGEAGNPSRHGVFDPLFSTPFSVYDRGEGGDGGFGAGGGFGSYNAFTLHHGNFPGIGGFGACDGTTGVRFWRSNPKPTDTRDQSGGSAGFGGGIFQYRGKLRLNRVGLEGNAATGGTGGIRVAGNASTDQAAGFGGAIFCWEEACLQSIHDSLVQNNTATLANDAAFNPVPNGGVNHVDFYGVGFPTIDEANATSSLTNALSYINPLTGIINEDSPFAYQYLLYEKEGGLVVPQYAKFEDDATSPTPNLAALESRIAELKNLRLIYPDSEIVARLLLDALYHYATTKGIQGDTQYQRCLAAPLQNGYNPDLDAEITELENALSDYHAGIHRYMECLKDPSTYATFRTLVPTIPYAIYYYLDSATGAYLPVPGVDNDLPNWQATRYRDLALLFELLVDYGRTAEMLARARVLRNDESASDVGEASNLVFEAQASLQTWGEILLDMFASELTPSDFRTPGLEESIALWRESVSQLTTLQSNLIGDTNPLGYVDDALLLLPVSAIDIGAGQSSFHSFDKFYDLFREANGLLDVAKADLATARTSLTLFEASKTQVETEANALVTSSQNRLEEILGDTIPVDSWFEVGSEVWEQQNNIQRAHSEITRNRIRIDNLNDEIQIEIDRVERQKDLNIDRDELVITYGDKVSKIDDQIATIETSQRALESLTSALSPTALTSGPLALISVGATIVNVAGQAGGDIAKGSLEDQKAELATQQMKDETAIDNQVLDVDSKAFIATRLLTMKELDLDSQVAAANLRQELMRLASLVKEADELRAVIANAQNAIAKRVYADPSQRLQVHNDYQKAIFSFRRAQQWLFFTTRALEYKRNEPFNFNGMNLEKLFQMRNADQLEDYANQLNLLNNNAIGDSEKIDWFSLREDSFGLTPGSADDAAFQAKFAPINGQHVITFSTLRAIPGSTFLTETEYLDKIRHFQVLLTFRDTPPSTSVTGNVRYGDVSYFRSKNLGTVPAGRPDQLQGEWLIYINRDWDFDSTAGNYVQVKRAAESFTIAQAHTSADRNAAIGNAAIFTSFRERSVAATNWVLHLPASIDLANLADVQIKFVHYSTVRNE